MTTLDRARREHLLQRIEELRPWRYNHDHAGIAIRADDPDLAEGHDRHARRALSFLVESLLRRMKPESRATPGKASGKRPLETVMFNSLSITCSVTEITPGSPGSSSSVASAASRSGISQQVGLVPV